MNTPLFLSIVRQFSSSAYLMHRQFIYRGTLHKVFSIDEDAGFVLLQRVDGRYLSIDIGVVVTSLLYARYVEAAELEEFGGDV